MSYEQRKGGRPQQGSSARSNNSYKEKEQVTAIEVIDIQLTNIKAELFDSVAKRTAETLGSNQKRDVNKSTQIRRFYDELLMWDAKAAQNPEKFGEYLPFIRMLNAKVAYAEGRGHIDANFTLLMTHCLQQVNDPKTLSVFKLFFEAMLGFYKLVGKD